MLTESVLSGWVHEILDNLDPAKVALTCANCAVVYNVVLNHLYTVVGVAVLIVLCTCMLLFSQHSTIAIATPMVTIGQWFRRGRGSPLRWYFARRERAMAKADRFQERSDELAEEICEWIESQRTAELWTDEECDVEYVRLKSRFPIFKYAVDNPGRAIEAIREELQRRLRVRNQKGVAATAPGIVKRNKIAIA